MRKEIKLKHGNVEVDEKGKLTVKEMDDVAMIRLLNDLFGEDEFKKILKGEWTDEK